MVYWVHMFISLEFSFQRCQTEREREKMEDDDFFLVLRTICLQRGKKLLLHYSLTVYY